MTAIHARDGRRIACEAHGLKGTFLTVGAEALAAACQELMIFGERGDHAAIATIYRPVQNQWDRMKEEAIRLVQTLTIAGATVPQ